MSLAPALAGCNIMFTSRACSEHSGERRSRVVFVREFTWITLARPMTACCWQFFPTRSDDVTYSHVVWDIRRRSDIPTRYTSSVEHCDTVRAVRNRTHDCFINLIDFAGVVIELESPLSVPVVHGKSLQIDTLEGADAVDQVTFSERAEFQLEGRVYSLVRQVKETAKILRLLDVPACKVRLFGLPSQKFCDISTQSTKITVSGAFRFHKMIISHLPPTESELMVLDCSLGWTRSDEREMPMVVDEPLRAYGKVCPGKTTVLSGTDSSGPQRDKWHPIGVGRRDNHSVGDRLSRLQVRLGKVCSLVRGVCLVELCNR